MVTSHDITILLASLGERELTLAENVCLARVVRENKTAIAKVRDDLWEAGEQKAATKVDRLISTYQD